MEMEPVQNCPVCSEPGRFSCPKCAKVSFCSIQHFKKHSKDYKDCFPGIIRVGPGGQSLEATRNIDVMEVILKETPIFIGPGSYEFCFKFHSQRDPTINITPICLGCYEILPIGFSGKCSSCKWPMHPGCENEPWHKLFECSYLRRVPFESCEPIQYYHITLLRFVLLPKVYPQVWEILEPIVETNIVRLIQDVGLKNVEILAISLKKKFRLKFKVATAVIGGIYKTIQLAGVFNVLPDEVSCTCIFQNTTAMNHSCMPNTRYTMLPYKNQHPIQIQVYAGRKIEAGTILTRNYADEGTIQDNNIRREKLEMVCGYYCTCQRCKDPRECSTNLSAIRCPSPDCPNAHSSYLLPVDTSDLSLKALWKCNYCPYEITYGHLQPYLDAELKKIISLKFKVAENRKGKNPNGNGKIKLRIYEVMLDGIETLLVNAENVVHPNHYTLWPLKDAYMDLASQALDVMPPGLKFQYSGTLICMAQSNLDVINFASPGISPITGRLLYYIAKGLEALLQILGCLPGNRKVTLRSMLERQFREAHATLKLIRRYPEQHSTNRCSEMMAEIEIGLDALKYEGISRLFQEI